MFDVNALDLIEIQARAEFEELMEEQEVEEHEREHFWHGFWEDYVAWIPHDLRD